MKKILLFLLCFLIQICTAYAQEVYYGIDVDKVYNETDWSSKDYLKQVIDNYTLFLETKDEFEKCPADIPGSTACFEKVTKQLLENFYEDFETAWADYLQFKKAGQRVYATAFCGNKFAGAGGTMCGMDTEIHLSYLLQQYAQTQLSSIEEFFRGFYFLADYQKGGG